MTFGKKGKAIIIITFPQSRRRRKNHQPLPSKNQSYKREQKQKLLTIPKAFYTIRVE